MEFNCDRFRNWLKVRREAKATAARQWHARFALLPIKVAPGKCIWLGYVMRKARLVRDPKYFHTRWLFVYKEPGGEIEWCSYYGGAVDKAGFVTRER